MVSFFIKLTLTPDQYEMIHSYYHLLDTIEEGLDYVIVSFTNVKLTEGDKILNDILSAFYHIDSSHLTLQVVFNEDRELVTSISQFDGVIMTLDQEKSSFITMEKKEFIKNFLTSAYLAWKETIQHHLKP